MRKHRKFRPSVGDAKLEERLVMARVSALAVVAAAAAKPVATRSAVNATVLATHNAYTLFLKNVTAAYNSSVRAVAAGVKTEAQVVSGMVSYVGKQLNALEASLKAAAGKLPYGAGNTPRPSGNSSLYQGAFLPIAEQFRIQNTNPIGPRYVTTLANIAAIINPTTIKSAYSNSRLAVTAYVKDGVLTRDFNYAA